MTTRLSTTRAPLATSRTSLAGTLMLAAGLLGAAAGAALAVWPREVTSDQFSYPLGATSHVAFQLLFTVQHLGLLAGILALSALARLVAGRATRAGLGAAVTGLVGLTVTEAVVAFLGLGITVTSARGAVLGSLYGLTSVTIGVGLVVAGAGLVRRPVLGRRGRVLPLALGVWVFLPLLPALAAPMVWGRLALIGWMLLFADLGLQLRRADRPERRP